MMDLEPAYRDAVMKMPKLLARLKTCPPTPASNASALPRSPGVYVLFDQKEAVYVGRSKNIRQRIGNHTSGRAEQSSFAFKLARLRTGRSATYTPTGSRKQLMTDPAFVLAFGDGVEWIRALEVRYVVIEDDILQHLFEVYAALAFKTRYNEFRTS